VSAPTSDRYRWLVLAAFVLSSAINYLDRQTLAALSPLLESEFHLSRAEFGWIIGAFSASYAISAPLAGLLIDRIGLNRAISMVIGVWSCAGIATGLTRGLNGLIGCRVVLGAAEAGGIPGAGKAIHQYLRPTERALGNALNQGCVSLGAILAPPVATWIAFTWNWRVAFVATGILGLLWIPLWNAVAAPTPPPAKRGPRLRHDPRLWTFALANALSMVGYSLWTNWTTQYLVDHDGLTLKQSVRYSWIPPVVALAGGFAGGWLSKTLIARGAAPVAGRLRVCLGAAILSLATFAVPLATTPAWTAAGISLSIFAVSAFSVNMYSLPLDAFGAARAAFGVSILVASYGVVQFFLSPAIGSLMDHRQWNAIAALAAVTPLAAAGVLWTTRSLR